MLAVVDLERLPDRIDGCRTVEQVDAQVVVEQRRYASAEAVQPGERVVADDEQQVHRTVCAIDGAGQLLVEYPRAVAARAVKQIVFELVEDHDDRAAQEG